MIRRRPRRTFSFLYPAFRLFRRADPVLVAMLIASIVILASIPYVFGTEYRRDYDDWIDRRQQERSLERAFERALEDKDPC